MKPDWKDAPPWAQWIAMDGDGYWYWFQYKPIFEDDQWVPTEEQLLDHARSQEATDEQDESGIDWDHAFDTLEERP